MLKMDSHIHSEYSPDSNSKIDDILKTAEKIFFNSNIAQEKNFFADDNFQNQF